MTDELLESRYHVGGMDCASCATKIETAVSRLPGVNTVTTSYTSETLRVQHTSTLARSSIERQVKALGYTIASTDKPSGEANDDDHFELGGGPWWKTRKAILTWACGLALVAAYLIGQMLPEIGHWAFSAALLVGLVPIGRRAISGAMHGTPFSIETLMSIAAIGAVFIGATEEAATVVLLFLVGELLEGVAAGRARASIRGLTDLVPKSALVERNGQTEEIQADALAIGDILMIRPGDRIAADGDIVEGSSSIDEAPVTGESVPKRKGAGDPVFAGTINTDCPSSDHLAQFGSWISGVSASSLG